MQRYQLPQCEDEDALPQAIEELADQYGRCDYRRITALLKRYGWQVGQDRVELTWRREGLEVPQKQKPRGRLRFYDRLCTAAARARQPRLVLRLREHEDARRKGGKDAEPDRRT